MIHTMCSHMNELEKEGQVRGGGPVLAVVHMKIHATAMAESANPL